MNHRRDAILGTHPGTAQANTDGTATDGDRTGKHFGGDAAAIDRRLR